MSGIANDEVVWEIINNQFCSFKAAVARERTFCQNPYNVTGLCLKSACPLANSRYATIREEEGICYLYMKTIERAHTPKKLWEKIRLPGNYTKALEIISGHLEHFPKYLVHRNKQRLTKIHQMLIRMRKLKLKARPKIITENTKVEKRERGKEKKALKAAQLERAIENELLERLKQVSEGEIYNYPETQYQKVLNKASKKYADEEGVADEDDEDEEYEVEEEEGDDEEEEEEDEGEYNIEYVADFDESEDEEEEMENAAEILKAAKEMAAAAAAAAGGGAGGKKRKASKTAAATSTGKKTKGARVEIEYEEDEVDERQLSRAKN